MNLEWIRFLKVSKESLESIGQHALINKKIYLLWTHLLIPIIKMLLMTVFIKYKNIIQFAKKEGWDDYYW